MTKPLTRPTPQSSEAEIEAKLAPLLRERARLRDEKALAEARALVGRCFKYRNCYSCPQEPSDYWWMYAKVTGVKDYSARSFRFQTDKDGKVEIESDQYHSSLSGYTEITVKEFNAAWRKCQQRIARMKP